MCSLLASTIPAFAGKSQEEKGSGGKALSEQHQAKPQHAHKSAPQHAQKSESQHAQRSEQQHPQKAETQRAQRSETRQARSTDNNHGNNGYRGNGNNGNHYGRISDANYHEHFGRDHSFHMMRPQFIGGYNRFQCGGYWFGFNVGWPYGWSYNDDVYVEYIDGGYFMYDLRHPGIHLRLSLML